MSVVPVHIFLSFSVNPDTLHSVLTPRGELPTLGPALDLLCLGRVQVSGLCDQNLHFVSEISPYSTHFYGVLPTSRSQTATLSTTF